MGWINSCIKKKNLVLLELNPIQYYSKFRE